RVHHIDLSGWLLHGLMLKEADFRAALKEHDWSRYQDALVTVGCSTDAIVAPWAYMLVQAYLQPFASLIVFGDETELVYQYVDLRLNEVDWRSYQDKIALIKGCGDKRLTAAL
ncbi:DUF2480 family protein, partial [Arthrospira platensis SPKY1]|nr:DUF2480 family protein [Arthrospira platensis SPKY1]